jgi:hypothetical protein
MFDRVSEAAEQLAVHVSRRDFCRWAGASAMALAALLTTGGIASAGTRTCTPVACKNNQTPCTLDGLCCPVGCGCYDPCGRGPMCRPKGTYGCLGGQVVVL